MQVHPEKQKEIAIWVGIKCTINRVGDEYFDQLAYSGHYKRGVYNLNLVATLGINMLRYPVLWERHIKSPKCVPNWSFTEKNLNHLSKLAITLIAGLVHHGSGPKHVSFFDGSFENGLAVYAKQVAAPDKCRHSGSGNPVFRSHSLRSLHCRLQLLYYLRTVFK